MSINAEADVVRVHTDPSIGMAAIMVTIIVFYFFGLIVFSIQSAFYLFLVGTIYFLIAFYTFSNMMYLIYVFITRRPTYVISKHGIKINHFNSILLKRPIIMWGNVISIHKSYLRAKGGKISVISIKLVNNAYPLVNDFKLVNIPTFALEMHSEKLVKILNSYWLEHISNDSEVKSKAKEARLPYI